MRYEKSNLEKVELVKGKVKMPSPVQAMGHGFQHAKLLHWLSTYTSYSRNVMVCVDATVHLDADDVVQPDALLRKIDRACRVEENGYLRGPPELWMRYQTPVSILIRMIKEMSVKGVVSRSILFGVLK